SVPPAPGWIARIAALASWGPDIMTFSSNSSRSLRRLATSAAISASRLPSSASAASSRSTVRSSARATSSFSRPTFRLSSVRSRMRSWARRLSSQKAGDAISASRAASRCSFVGMSKMPPELVDPHGEVLPRAGRAAEPSVVRHVHDQPRSTSHELADELGKDSLVTDYDTERGRRTLEYHRVRARLELGDELGPASNEPEQTRERDELSEWDEVNLIISLDDAVFSQ